MDARTKWQSLNLNDYEGDEWGPDAVAGIAGDYIAELEEDNKEAQRSEAYHIQKLNFITEKYNAMLARCEEDPPYFWRTRTTRDDAWYQAMEHVKGNDYEDEEFDADDGVAGDYIAILVEAVKGEEES